MENPWQSVDSASSLGINFSYMMTDNFSVEAPGAYPFEHDIELNANGSKVGSTETTNPLDGLKLSLDDSRGFAGEIAAVRIDPWVYSVMAGIKI